MYFITSLALITLLRKGWTSEMSGILTSARAESRVGTIELRLLQRMKDILTFGFGVEKNRSET